MNRQNHFIKYKAAGGVLTETTSTRILVLVRPARDEVRLPKGHVEPGETLPAAALREVTEETGYDDVEILSDLGEQLVAFPLQQKVVQRTEHYYLMRVRSKQQRERPAMDDEQFFPIWVAWEEALNVLTYEAEQEWVRRAHKVLEQQ